MLGRTDGEEMVEEVETMTCSGDGTLRQICPLLRAVFAFLSQHNIYSSGCYDERGEEKGDGPWFISEK